MIETLTVATRLRVPFLAFAFAISVTACNRNDDVTQAPGAAQRALDGDASCPDLTGTFRCDHDNSRMVITQHLDGQTWNYTFRYPDDPSSNAVNVMADGVPRSYAMLHQGNTSFSCDDNHVLHEDFTNPGESAPVNVTWSLNSQRDLQLGCASMVDGKAVDCGYAPICRRQ